MLPFKSEYIIYYVIFRRPLISYHSYVGKCGPTKMKENKMNPMSLSEIDSELKWDLKILAFDANS